MSENILNDANKLKLSTEVEKLTIKKNLVQKDIQNISFYSFIRLLFFPNQIELKDHSVRVKDPKAETFSLKQKHEFSKVFSPSASDFTFFTKSLEKFSNNSFLVLAVFGSIDIRRLFNYLDFKSYYLFEFDLDMLEKLIHKDIDFSNEQPIPITNASSSTYITPKIHYLIDGKSRRNITIYISEGYLSIVRTLRQMSNDNKELTIILLSQLNDSHKDKYNSILSTLSLSTKSLISPKPKTNDDNNRSNSSLNMPKTNLIKPEKSENVIESTPIISNCIKADQKSSTYSPKNKVDAEISNLQFSVPQKDQNFNKSKDQFHSLVKISEKTNKDNQINESHTRLNNPLEINNEPQSTSNESTTNDPNKIQKIQNSPNTSKKGTSQSTFLKQMMENTSSSPNELSGIFDTLGSIIKRSEDGWKQTDSELYELQSKLDLMKTEQSKEAELLRIAETNLEQLQTKLFDIKNRRINLLNEKEKLNSYVSRSISITTKMKMQVREVVDRSSSYEKKINETTQEMISDLESEASETIQSHELMTEMAILEAEIDNHLKA